MILKRFFLVLLCSLPFCFSQAQDTLLLFTKHDCQVCIQTKQVLSARGIPFLEKDVALSANASEMLNKLSASGLKGSIHMPVIYLGKNLMHPAYCTGKGLQTVEINAVVDSIMRKYNTGMIAQINLLPAVSVSTNSPSESSADCEHIVQNLYLVVADYRVETEAVNAVKILIKHGYPNSGFIFERSVFRVYVDLFSDFKSASEQLSKEKIRFADAYLLPKK